MSTDIHIKIELIDKPTFRIDEVARIFCVTPRTVREWIREGKIPGCIKVGGHTIRIPKGSIIGLITTYE